MIFDFLFESQYAIATIAVAAFLVVVYNVARFLEPKADPLEPRFARSAVPLVGHIIGFMRFGNRYLEDLMCVDSLRCPYR